MKKRLLRSIAVLQVALTSATPGLLSFPHGFLWGASTSSEQVEGNTTNNWTIWEQANAQHLASTAPKRLDSLPDWNQIKSQATDPSNYIAGDADDDYNLYPQDLALAKSLGLTSYRFSLEWSRIEPKPGVFDQSAIIHYQQEIATVKADGMQPFVTIWHWTEPTWFTNQGGWLGSQAVKEFDAYSSVVAKDLGTDSTFWVTINEPMVYAGNSYLEGAWPPQKHNIFDYFTVTNNLAQAQNDTYTLLHTANPKAQVGIASSQVYFDADGTWWGAIAKTVADYWYNYQFLDKTRNYEDYIGVNYYMHNNVGGAKSSGPVSDMGWQLYPSGMYNILTQVYNRYHKPIYITEDGLADASDTNRAAYITQTLQSVHQAINDGADVRGYSYWSLLDNFEWAEGKWPRFGLIAVNYATEQRTIRPSAWDYADIIKQNGVSP